MLVQLLPFPDPPFKQILQALLVVVAIPVIVLTIWADLEEADMAFTWGVNVHQRPWNQLSGGREVDLAKAIGLTSLRVDIFEPTYIDWFRFFSARRTATASASCRSSP